MLDTPLKYKRKSYKKRDGKIVKEVFTTSHDNEKIIIIIEHFDDLQFIKFYPNKYKHSKEKYQRFFQFNKLPIKIFSTCIDIARERFENNPKVTIGVYGQWDFKDVELERSSSHRYYLWLRCAASKFDRKKYYYGKSEDYNFFYLTKVEHHNNKKKKDLENQLINHFGEKHKEFMVGGW